MRRQARHDRKEAAVSVEARDVALAIGRVGQAVQQHDGTDRLAVRLQHEGAVEILLEAPRIDRAAVEIAVDRNAIVLRQLLGDLAPQFIEDFVLARDILLPVGDIELRCAQFLRNEGVPRLERQAALGIVDAHPEQRHEYQRCGRRRKILAVRMNFRFTACS